MEQGEKFDTVCEAGLFDLYANSYLVFWSADPKQLQKDDERIFIKYNKTRREEFQIKTCICERNVIGAAGASGAAGADATKEGFRERIFCIYCGCERKASIRGSTLFAA